MNRSIIPAWCIQPYSEPSRYTIRVEYINRSTEEKCFKYCTEYAQTKDEAKDNIRNNLSEKYEILDMTIEQIMSYTNGHYMIWDNMTRKWHR